MEEITVERLESELRKLQDLKAIEYYLPTIPASEQYIVGVKGEILKMDTEQTICFLAGVTAATELLARKFGAPPYE